MDTKNYDLLEDLLRSSSAATGEAAAVASLAFAEAAALACTQHDLCRGLKSRIPGNMKHI